MMTHTLPPVQVLQAQQRNRRNPEMLLVRLLGREAHDAGHGYESCPFPSHTDEYVAWQDGYRDAYEEQS